MTIVLASAVIYELIGPVCARFALFHSGCIKTTASETEQQAALQQATAAVTINGAVADCTTDSQSIALTADSDNQENCVSSDVTERTIGIAKLICKGNFKK